MEVRPDARIRVLLGRKLEIKGLGAGMKAM